MHCAPVRLRCEYLENPLGIDLASPRLSWWPIDTRPAELQTAYEIIAASTRDLLGEDEGDLWHSGRVESQQSFNVPYRGKRLISGRRVWWKVRSFDSDGLPSPWSAPAFFEAGLLDEADWHARWIAAPLAGSRITSVPAACLRRVFELAGRPKRARVYVAALGLHQLEINGTAINEDELVPGWTDFNHKAAYQSYDVTDHLRAGSNVIGVLLADGWFAGRSGLGDRQHYGERPELRLQLQVTLDSGATLIIGSDERWQWRPSWILQADPIAGESCDWSQHDPSWSTAQSTGPWFPVVVVERDLRCVGMRQPPVRKLREIQPELRAADERRYLFELPQTVLGRARLEGSLPPGALLRVRYGQQLDSSGELEAGPGEDVHIAQGSGGIESFCARFSVHGFRYLELSGDLFALPGIEVSVAIYGSAPDLTADFICDHRPVNDLFDGLVGHLQHCLHSIPFAGLSPSHRHGRLAGAGQRSKGLLQTLGAAAGIRNWLEQMCAEQFEDGRFPELIPAPPDLDDLVLSPGAGDAVLDTSWQLFRQYGDRAALEKGFRAGCRYLAGMAKAHPDHICGEPPDDLHATLRYYRSVRTAARMAGVLGQLVELEELDLQAAEIRKAFRRRFVSTDGRVVGDDLRGYTAVLSRGMLEPQQRPRALTELFRYAAPATAPGSDVEPVADLLRTLTLLGRVDLAYSLVLEYAAAQDPLSDQRAMALVEGGVLDWLLGCLAGLDLGRDLSESCNAWRRLRIQPRPLLGSFDTAASDACAGPPLRAVEAALDTISGRWEVRWFLGEEAFELTVVVPCNCSADVIMPDESVHEIVAGTHQFSMPLREASDGIPILREVSAGH